MVNKKTSYKLFNQEPIKKIFVNLIFTQINDDSVNLFRGVYFLIKVCHNNHIIFKVPPMLTLWL